MRLLRTQWGRWFSLPLTFLISTLACNFPGLAEMPDQPLPNNTPIIITATPDPINSPTQAAPSITNVPVTAIPTIAYTPTFEASACLFAVPSGYSPECGFLIVPENRTDANTEMIRLHVAIFRSPNPAPDPIIQLAGGPGSHGTNLISYHFATGAARLLDDRDLIFFDQRGTGESEPSLTCPERDDISGQLLESDLPIDRQNQLEIDAYLACRDRLLSRGINLASYNSAASAADVNDLRIALGYDQINLYGVSYGTRLALTIMRDYPHIIRSAILDSVYPPEQNLYVPLAANAERSFDAMFSACASDPDCAATYPDLESTFYQTVDSLNASPVRVSVNNPNDGLTYDALLTGDLLVDIVFVTMYRPDVMVNVPQLIADIRSSYYSPFLQRRLALYFDRTSSRGMTVSVQCHEEIPFSTYGELAAAGESAQPQVAHNYVLEMKMFYDLCPLWGAGLGAPFENEPVRSSIPTLIFAGRFDPITPPEWGLSVSEALDNAYFFEFPVGHWSMRSSLCPVQIAAAFVNDPATPPDGSCALSIPEPDFTP